MYCQFSEGICTRTGVSASKDCLFFAYPSKPETTAEAIQRAIHLLSQDKDNNLTVIDWKSLPIEGNVIFCEICEAIRKSTCVILNTTYINFNIMFEYGFAIGSQKTIWPIVEEGVAKTDRTYTRIETLTTIGHGAFANGREIYYKLQQKKPWQRAPKFSLPQPLRTEATREAINLLYLQSTYDTEPSLRISEALSSIPMGKIVDNPRDVPFQPLSWYLTNIAKSYAVIVHLGSERVDGYNLHWAKCALVAGMALALGRRLLILGEKVSFKPIDYHDIIKSYTTATKAGEIALDFVSPINNIIFDFKKYIQYDITLPKRIKESKAEIIASIDLGDYKAENEEEALSRYFVETPEFQMALKPAYKVFIGRRGTGKTANYYMILNSLLRNKSNLVCNIKPEEWQLDELQQFIERDLDKAKKGYLLQSLWKFMIYSEAIKFCHEKIETSRLHSGLSKCEEDIENYVERNQDLFQLSFTSRLINTVRKVCMNINLKETVEVAVSEILHIQLISDMHKMLMNYVKEKKGNCAIVIDSLDTNWTIGPDYKVMASILLSLLETTRDVWRMCTKRLNEEGNISSGLSMLIFLRSDIFKVVLEVAREPDKLDYELIYWKDINSLMEIVNQRILASLADLEIEKVLNWEDLLELGYSPEDMKNFLKENILFRPRDFIFFFQRCFYIARSRNSEHLTKADFETAMIDYSEHAFKSLCAETQPYIPNMQLLLYEFAGKPCILSKDRILEILKNRKVTRNVRATINFLLESNFLGFKMDDASFHFPLSPTELSIVSRKVWQRKKSLNPKVFTIHNAFHNALLIEPV